MKDVKIVIGANYGDEGKGLMTRHFAKESLKEGKDTIVVLHNGTAQRGHTVDYNPDFRHVYHHFGSGTIDGAATYFSKTFWIHPMTFSKEIEELKEKRIIPYNTGDTGALLKKELLTFYDPNALVVTPFDMLVDHATEAYIQCEHDEREYGSCGLGTWCATERFPYGLFTIEEWIDAWRDRHKNDIYKMMLNESYQSCFNILIKRKIDLDKILEYKKIWDKREGHYQYIEINFAQDLSVFYHYAKPISFSWIYDNFNTLIFENGQGLGLDQNVDNEWHTTSNTGIINPYELLKDKEGFKAEVCYVSRSYLTRHGEGPLEQETTKKEINSKMVDKTNIPNEFQGTLRYGGLDLKEQNLRINKDFDIIKNDLRFNMSKTITHCNEFEPGFCGDDFNYMSYNPYSVLKK